MIGQQEAEEFVQEWIAAWNSHDIERILSHWRDDAVFTSPRVAKVVPERAPTINGKGALREYWQRVLSAASDLHFDLLNVYIGAESLVIGYANHRDQVCAEALWIDDDGLAYQGAAHYAHKP